MLLCSNDQYTSSKKFSKAETDAKGLLSQDTYIYCRYRQKPIFRYRTNLDFLKYCYVVGFFLLHHICTVIQLVYTYYFSTKIFATKQRPTFRQGTNLDFPKYCFVGGFLLLHQICTVIQTTMYVLLST